MIKYKPYKVNILLVVILYIVKKVEIQDILMKKYWCLLWFLKKLEIKIWAIMLQLMIKI
jgi:hypothetical protein